VLILGIFCFIFGIFANYAISKELLQKSKCVRHPRTRRMHLCAKFDVLRPS